MRSLSRIPSRMFMESSCVADFQHTPPGGRCGSPESCPERRIRVRSPKKRVRIGGEGPIPSVPFDVAAVVAATTRQMRTSVRV